MLVCACVRAQLGMLLLVVVHGDTEGGQVAVGDSVEMEVLVLRAESSSLLQEADMGAQCVGGIH